MDHKPEGPLDVLFNFFILIVFVSKVVAAKNNNTASRTTVTISDELRCQRDPLKYQVDLPYRAPCFLHEVTGLGSLTSLFHCLSRNVGRADGDEKMSPNQKQIPHKMQRHSSAETPPLAARHREPAVKKREVGNGGKHVTSDPSDKGSQQGQRGDPRERKMVLSQSALTAHFLPRQEVRCVTNKLRGGHYHLLLKAHSRIRTR